MSAIWVNEGLRQESEVIQESSRKQRPGQRTTPAGAAGYGQKEFEVRTSQDCLVVDFSKSRPSRVMYGILMVVNCHFDFAYSGASLRFIKTTQ
ncbi:MAG TPA: hypothetical protein VK616_15495 [Flavitalea sp.]|nr:hypothetical protein [Flavitalea sp.]HTF31326.1 hypothetical protein [Flavitalea sp.]